MRDGMLKSGEETDVWAAKSDAAAGIVLSVLRLGIAGRYNALRKRVED